jgi:hypothetical protein
MNDDRIKKTTTPTSREDRATEDESRRPPEDVNVSAEQRRKMWRDSWTQSALPQLQTLPGWHLCWLSTANQYDTIDKRMRLGYVPVKAEELGITDVSRVKDGEYAGFISCNEMLLFKIPMEAYQEVMTMMHHDAPNDDSANIRRKVEEMQARDNNGKVLGSVEGDGLAAIAEQRPAPVFAG